MSEKTKTSVAMTDSKPHYELLDGLRGVAALMVIWYHVFEGFATSPFDQMVNHGYLAVDFFFILSGFVIAYSYDDRWSRMTVSAFLRRRLVRLHPMVIAGAVWGCAAYMLQGCVKWDGTEVSPLMVVLALVAGMLLIPLAPHTGPDVRGNGEMYPLNGPSWSLFFEYLGNIMYALFIRRMSTRLLGLFVALSGAGLVLFALGNLSGYGHLGVGWTLADYNFPGGLLRVTFSFAAGQLLARVYKPSKVRGAFWICSASIVFLLSMPYVGTEEAVWMNGLYDSVCVVVVFPLLVYLGASGKPASRFFSRTCKLLGDISYPLYIIHYPTMYLFYAWVWDQKLAFGQVWPAALGLFFGNILLAFLLLKVYDEPVRKRLGKWAMRVRKTAA